jgi:leucyl aminopeptidase
MEVSISREPKWSKVDHLFLLLVENAKPPKHVDLPKGVAKLIEASRFSGRSEETITLLADEPRKVTLLGLGKEDGITIRSLRAALYAVGKTAKKQRDKTIAVAIGSAPPKLSDDEATRIAADHLSHTDYKYDAYMTPKKDETPIAISATLVPFGNVDAKRAKALDAEAKAIAAGIRIVRDLGNAPGNEMTPTRIGQRAEEVAKAHGLKCTVYDKRAIEKMKMGGLLAVNKGSHEEPRFIVLEYHPRRAKTHVALVGKGITFDSGGISIKPADKMEEMKFDMCGAAAVIGTMQAAAMLGLDVRITGVIASTENLPGGAAYKPGDIIRTMSGKTIEVVNTDAEGRVILADALHYASQQKPDHILDYATLTGACVVALGSEAAGLFSNNDELAQKLIACGEETGERIWRLPEWDEYKELIRSDWADIKNSGGRWGGAISAALFLKEFVDCPSWAHFDIAGTAYAEHETAREARGATGAGVRLTLRFLESL